MSNNKESIMIYTSYMGNLVNIKEIEKVSIMRNTPSWCNEYIDKKDLSLAPSQTLLNNYKNNEISSVAFERGYLEELSKLNINKIAKKYKNKVLLCTCKIGEVCHRHILANYLISNDIMVTELKVKDRLKKIKVKDYHNKTLKENELLITSSLDGKYRKKQRTYVLDYNRYKSLPVEVLTSTIRKELYTLVTDALNGKTIYLDIHNLPTDYNALGEFKPSLAIKMSNLLLNQIIKYKK